MTGEIIFPGEGGYWFYRALQGTDGQVCYGFVLNEGCELPWDADDYDGDYEEWWAVQRGWKPTEEEKYAFRYLKGDPCPFKLVNVCSPERPMYILAVAEPYFECSRGYPERLTASGLKVASKDLEAFRQFIEDYGPFDFAKPVEADWFLSSYSG